LFVAVDPPPEATDDLRTLVGRLAVAQAGARLAAPDTWHVTVAFLGDVPASRVEVAGEAVARAAAVMAPIPLRIAGGGRFGRGRFTVLWAGLVGDTGALATLALLVRRGLKRARLPFDDRPYRPHLTIARPGDRVPRDTVDADRDLLDAHTGPEWTADTVHLYRSFLGPQPRYVRLGSWPLNGDSPT